MKKSSLFWLWVLLLPWLFISCNQEPQVYEWRGTDRAGVYPDQGLLKTWPDGGPELVWEFDGLGNGFGSPVFTPEGMYITGELDSLAWLFYFDTDGELVWKKDFGPEWVKNWNGSRSAPTIIDDQAFVVSGMGALYAFERFSGDVLWSVNMVEDLGGEFPLFGFSEAPAVEGDVVFCTPGGPENNVVALNRFSGEVVWSNPGMGERPGYNQPRIIELESRSVLVTFSAYHALALDTQTGELLWTHVQDNTPPEERKPGTGDTHANTILYENGSIYYAEGDGNCGVRLLLSEDGSSIEEVWRNSDFDSYMSGIIKLGDYLYGTGTRQKDLRCVLAETGETISANKLGVGVVLSADNMLYFYNWSGEVMLITPDPQNMEVKGLFKITKGSKQHFAHPVIHDSKLYVRRGEVIQAYDIKDHSI